MHPDISFLLLAFLLAAASAVTLVEQAALFNVYRPNDVASPATWYINDHTFVYGPGGEWHLFAITHTDPMDPDNEINAAHATAPPGFLTAQVGSLGAQWIKRPFALGAKGNETHLWAPYVFKNPLVPNQYIMFYCGGGADREKSMINVAVSSDLYHWTRRGTAFTGGIDGRDPMVLPLNNGKSGFIIYYTGTDPDSVNGKVEHVTYCRSSTTMEVWGDARICFRAGSDGVNYGGPTESPFVVQRGTNYYLFTGDFPAQNDAYRNTHVYMSKDPWNFGSVPQGTANQVGKIISHAPEIVRDTDGSWYASSAGWGQGGVWLSQLKWLDGLDDQPTNLPIPSNAPPLPSPVFSTNIPFTTNFTTQSSKGISYDQTQTTQWVTTPNGIAGGCALTHSSALGPVSYDTTAGLASVNGSVILLTRDGNPGDVKRPETKKGSAAGILMQTADGGFSFVAAIYIDLTASPTTGILFATMNKDNALNPVQFIPLSIIQEQSYVMQLTIDASRSSVDISVDSQKCFTKAIPEVSLFSGPMKAGLWVMQSSATFQSVYFSTHK